MRKAGRVTADERDDMSLSRVSRPWGSSKEAGRVGQHDSATVDIADECDNTGSGVSDLENTCGIVPTVSGAVEGGIHVDMGQGRIRKQVRMVIKVLVEAQFGHIGILK